MSRSVPKRDSVKEVALVRDHIFDYKSVIKDLKEVVMADRSQLGLARIERETVQDRVYSVLRDQLMRGGFEPGQKLKIADLASALGTSAMPVREALNRLVAERAIESMPNRSVRVPSLSKESLRDLMEARCAIEGLAVGEAGGEMEPG